MILKILVIIEQARLLDLYHQSRTWAINDVSIKQTRKPKSIQDEIDLRLIIFTNNLLVVAILIQLSTC